MKPHHGTLILVFGILGLIICGPLGIVAWVMGANDLREMNTGTMDPGGRGMTQAGKICGMIATILMIIAVIIGVLIAGFGILVGAHNALH